MVFCVWSCLSCLRLCQVDDGADGDVDAADAADLHVVGDQADGVGHAVGDVVGDDKDAAHHQRQQLDHQQR